MAFDLSQYVSLEAFITLWIAGLIGLACYGFNKGKRNG
jgi:hypothetical protein